MNNINIEFSENIVRVLKLNDSREIILKEEIELGFNINDVSYLKKNKKEALNIFSEKFGELAVSDEAGANNACVLLETSQTFLNVFPIDFHEDINSINSHILWELSNYFPDTYKDYIVKYYRLNNNYLNEKIDEVLLIAVDKNKIDIMKNLCNGSGMKIINIDIDQFAIESCIKENYKEEFTESNVLLIGCKNTRLDFSLISKGKIKYYDFQNTGKENYRSLIEKQISFLTSMAGAINIDRIFLYGIEKAGYVKSIIEKEMNDFPVSLISLLKTNENSADQNEYAPLYGLALRNFSK